MQNKTFSHLKAKIRNPFQGPRSKHKHDNENDSDDGNDNDNEQWLTEAKLYVYRIVQIEENVIIDSGISIILHIIRNPNLKLD